MNLLFTQPVALVLIACGAFFITYITIPVIIKVSHSKRLYDDGGSSRKLHLRATPNLGGLAIFAAITIVFGLSGYADLSWFPYMTTGLTLLLLSGIKDDIFVISPAKKLILQFAAAGILLWGGGLVITDLGGVFGIHRIPFWAGTVLTLFTMIVVINAYNLIDGIDGLAGTVGIAASVFFAWWFWQAGMMGYSVLAIILAASLLAFLKFNFHPASIFMGDTGSQIIGFILAFFAVSFVATSTETVQLIPLQQIAPVLVLAVLIVPLYDTLRVFLLRVFKKNSPFKPDRLHIHHQLLDMGFSHPVACYIILCFNIFIIAVTVALHNLDINILFGVILLSGVLLFPTLGIKRNLLKKAGIKLMSGEKIKTGKKRREKMKAMKPRK